MDQDEDRPMWRSWQFPTITSPFIPQHEIDQVRQDMDPRSFGQELCDLPTTEILLASGESRAMIWAINTDPGF